MKSYFTDEARLTATQLLHSTLGLDTRRETMGLCVADIYGWCDHKAFLTNNE